MRMETLKTRLQSGGNGCFGGSRQSELTWMVIVRCGFYDRPGKIFYEILAGNICVPKIHAEVKAGNQASFARAWHDGAFFSKICHDNNRGKRGKKKKNKDLTFLMAKRS